MSIGPQKIVLIQSGRYDYGEVDLSGALQIVGPNNTGKTTLINTLQFLYIDDLRRMDFGSYTPEQTRAYYFPSQYSYLLFECLGAHGKCVIGWRGQSKASGAEPERFYYAGAYETSDFLDEKSQVREPRDVSGRLALKDFRIIRSAQEHRELLLPAASAKDRGLGIILLKDTDKYHHFRETLKNLLTLSTLTQEQMRDRLLMLAEIPPDRVALDARELFGEDYDRIRQRRDKLRRFKSNQSAIQLLVSKFQEREAIRGAQIYRWTDLRGKRDVFIKEHEAGLAKLRVEMQSQREKADRCRAELHDRRGDLHQFSEQKGGVALSLNQIAEAGKQFADFVEDLERAAIAQLQQRIRAIDLQLSQAETESRDRIGQKLDFHRDAARQKETAIARFDEALVSELRKHFSDDQIESLFRLLNRDLLEYPVGGEGVRIDGPVALKARVERLLSHFDGLFYRDEDIAIRFANEPGGVARVPNVPSLKQQLAEHRETILKLEQILRAIEQRESLVAERKKAVEDLEAKNRRLLQFEEFQVRKAEEPRFRAELKRILDSISAAQERVALLERQTSEAERAENSARNLIVQTENEFNAVMGRFGGCVFPEFAAKALPVENIPNDFDAAIALFLREQTNEKRLRSDLEMMLRDLERSFGDEFIGQDEHETVRNFQSELEALAEKEEALTRDWNAHVHGLRAAFDNVLKELSHLRIAADQLNRQFGKVQVSNLKQLRMEVVEQADMVSWLRKLADIQQPGLFDDDTRLEPALKTFRQKLESNPIIRYADLFSLGFTVTGADDRKHTYHDFRQIESHGTTITIKVLFNLLLLKSQLRKDLCQVPFFLDEIQALDPANRHAILATARQLGFVAITAAPDSVSEVDTLYFLQPRQGRIVLRNKHRVKVRMQHEPVSPI